MRRCARLLLLLASRVPSLRVPTHEEVGLADVDQAFPSDCPETGILRLRGRYKVSSEVSVTRDCHVVALEGAELQLHAQIFFAKNAIFRGSISFHGVDHRGTQSRCLDVEGDALFDSARVRFVNCGSLLTEDGGGLYVEKSLRVYRSYLEFRHCRSGYGGSIFVRSAMTIQESELHVYDSRAAYHGGGIHVEEFDLDIQSKAIFQNCAAKRGGGGAMLVMNGTLSSDGDITISKCKARTGGGIALLGSPAHFVQRGGSIKVTDAVAEWNQGGCIYVDEEFKQEEGSLFLQRCEASGSGGGLYAVNAYQMDGEIHVADSAGRSGGAIYADRDLRVAGEVITRNNSARDGGSIWASMLLVSSGVLRARQSHATADGGALCVTSLKVTGGSVELEDAWAESTGGGIHAALLVTQTGGSIAIRNATSSYGGGIKSFWLAQKGGTMTFDGCRAEIQRKHPAAMGGAAFVHAGVVQGKGAEMTMANTSSADSGGALGAVFVISRGSMAFRDVRAVEKGGCIFLHKYRHMLGARQKNFRLTMIRLAKDVAGYAMSPRGVRNQLYQSDFVSLAGADHVFDGCKAGLGGAILSAGSVTFRGKADFRDAVATSVRGGAAMNARSVKLVTPVTFTNASVPDGGVICTQLSFQAKRQVTFVNSPAPQIQSATHIRIEGPNSGVVVRGSSAGFLAPMRRIQSLSCENGLEGFVDSIETGCHRCRPGFFQLQGGPVIKQASEVLGHRCIQAPEGTEQDDQVMKIRPGFMLLSDNLSTSLRCPNLMACPGGRIMAIEDWQDMCEVGYEGPGCVNCRKGTHGRVSNNPFACAACAHGAVRKVVEWSWFILQNSVIFAVSASGVLMVETESYKSTILTNQLMSYVTVSLPVLTAVSYSKTFRRSAVAIQDVLETLQIPVAIADSGGGEGLSVQCLLGYVGLQRTLYGTDLVFFATALCLMSALCWWVDFWSAVVVGFNCFLPRICFCLGRHLVCYRMLPQAQGGVLTCGFEEDAHIPKPMACVLIAICFVVGVGMWAVLIRYRRESSSPGVTYLTNAYTESCRMWEITVLLRKMTLMVVNAILPVSLHAALQMECISVILLGSLVLNHRYAPYVLKANNRSESVLLILALTTVTLTSCYKANELDWSKSETAQQVMMIMIILLATGPAVVMTIQITIALCQELMEVPAEQKGEKEAH